MTRQKENGPGNVANSANGQIDHPLIPAKRVLGADVYNQANEMIGRIEDVAIDKRTGKVAYAILSFGGFLTIGEKHQPLPWSCLDYDMDRGGYVVDITQEFLALAPKLEVSDLSGWDDKDGREALHQHYRDLGAKPYWTPN